MKYNSLKVYCINLEHRKDRKQHSLEQFIKLGIPHDNVTYPYFTKDKRGGSYGCFDSHMKVYNDFFTNYPNDKYCLVFEDDFVAPPNGKHIIKKSIKFLNDNYYDIDILFLHNICVPLEHKSNNEHFTSGYGYNATAYLITRHYIQSIITKYGKLPEPIGIHIDIEIAINKDKDNMLYSNKLFYTKKECIKQLINKSDNYLNKFDELFRRDHEKTQKNIIDFFKLTKKYKIFNDDQIKKISYTVMNILTTQ